MKSMRGHLHHSFLKRLANLALLTSFLTVAAMTLWSEHRGVVQDRLGQSLARQDNDAFIVPLDAFSTNLAVSPENSDGVPFLWALGPEMTMVFHTLAPMHVVLGLGFDNPVEGQSVTLSANGATLDRIDNVPRTQVNSPGLLKDYIFKTRKGLNTLRLEFRLWNHHGVVFAPGDPRRLALRITKLTLLPAQHPRNGL